MFLSVISYICLNLALYFAVKYLFYCQLNLCLDQGITEMWGTIYSWGSCICINYAVSTGKHAQVLER